MNRDTFCMCLSCAWEDVNQKLQRNVDDRNLCIYLYLSTFRKYGNFVPAMQSLKLQNMRAASKT